jgi:hypothetical protein
MVLPVLQIISVEAQSSTAAAAAEAATMARARSQKQSENQAVEMVALQLLETIGLETLVFQIQAVAVVVAPQTHHSNQVVGELTA